MKPLLLIASILLFTSCKKNISTQEEKTTVYLYQLVSQDLDSQISVSNTGIKSVRVITQNNSISATSEVPYVNSDDDKKDPCYCLKHPYAEGCKLSSLPMKIDYFEYQYNKQSNTIKFVWKTSFEDNIYKFYILKSTNGTDFDIVTKIDPHGALKEYDYTEILK